MKHNIEDLRSLRATDRISAGMGLRAGCAMLLLSLPATAADWIGDTDADWATETNWSEAPVEGSALVFQAAGASGTVLGNTLEPGFEIGGIAFSTDADSFTMGGNAFDLAGNITQSSTTTQTLDHDITIVGAARTLDVAAGGTLTLGGAVDGGGFRLDKTGGGTLAIAGSAWAIEAIVTPWTANSTIDIPEDGFLAAVSLNFASGIASTVGKVNITCAGDLTVSGDFALNNNVAGAVAMTQTGGVVSLTSATDNGFNNVVAIAARVGAATRNDYHLQDGTLNVPNTSFYCAVGGAASGRLDISGGTANLKGLKLSGTSTSAVGALVLDGGRLNLGDNGLVNGATNMAGSTVTLGAGTLGALDDWSTAKNMILSDPGTGVTIDTLDAADGITPRTITLDGVLSGEGSLVKEGEGVLNLEAANTYTGNTVVNAGELRLGFNGRLRFAPAGNGDCNTLSGSGAVTLDGFFFLDFASAAIADGNQWQLVTAAGVTYDASFVVDSPAGMFARTGTLHTLEADGNTWTFDESTGLLRLEVTAAGYDLWAFQIPDPDKRDRDDDADKDGFTNLQEFLFGSSPVSPGGSLVQSSRAGGHLVIRWLQRDSGTGYSLTENAGLSGQWSPSEIVPEADPDQSGVPADHTRIRAEVPLTGGANFFRVEAQEL